jgi:tetratricopeptide (TPR) repeat protein
MFRKIKELLTVLLWTCLITVSCNTNMKDQADRNAGSDSSGIVLQTLTSQIEDDATNPGLYHARARYYLAEHHYDNALKDIHKAITLEPGNAVFYITLSDIYLLQGQTNNCNDALVKAISVDPKNQDAVIKMAKLYLILKDYSKTFDYVKRAIDLNQINPRAYFIRAIALLEKGDTSLAVNDLIKAVDQDQSFYEAYIQLGELFSLRKDPMAADYLKNALALQPESREALYMLGMFYQETGQFDKAITTYQRLQKADTTFRNAPYNIGYIYLVYLKDFPLAVRFFSEAIKKDAAYFEAYFNRGYAEELMGNYAKSYEDYQTTLKIKVNYDKAIQGLNRLDKMKIRK